MSRTAFFTDERTFWHFVGMQALISPVGGWVQVPNGAVGADTPDSKRRILSLVCASGLAEKLRVSSAAPATHEDLLRVHDAAYLTRFRAASDADGGNLGDFAPFGPGAYEIACLSAGLAIALIDDVLRGTVDNGFALCRPAGHHCLRDRSMGFCLLANIPIAIEAAKARHAIGRVAVVDWDVHHGNGTQSIFYERSDVLTISLHQDRCFPPGYSGVDERGSGEGLGYSLNIPLPAGSGHEAYMCAMDQIVIPALERYRPDLIVVASGLDANGLDPLARMMLHSESYRLLATRIKQCAEQLCAGRLAIVHEGGYAESYVPFCGHAIVETLSGVRTAVVDPLLELLQLQQPDARQLAFQKDWIAKLAAQLQIDRLN